MKSTRSNCLIIVTPEFVDPIDACEAPCGGPGTFTTSPDNRDLYCGGHVEVPAHCNPTRGLGACGRVRVTTARAVTTADARRAAMAEYRRSHARDERRSEYARRRWLR